MSSRHPVALIALLALPLGGCPQQNTQSIGPVQTLQGRILLVKRSGQPLEARRVFEDRWESIQLEVQYEHGRFKCIRGRQQNGVCLVLTDSIDSPLARALQLKELEEDNRVESTSQHDELSTGFLLAAAALLFALFAWRMCRPSVSDPHSTSKGDEQ